MAKKNTSADLSTAPAEIEAKAETQAPPSLGEQIKKLQTVHRTLEAQIAQLREREKNVSTELTRLLALAGLDRKMGKFHEGLNETEKELLKQASNKPAS